MNIRRVIITVIASLLTLTLLGQTGGVKGLIINRLTSSPLKDAKVTIYLPAERKFVYTLEDGRFEILGIEDGMYRMEIEAAHFIKTEINVKISNGEVYDLMNVTVAPDISLGDLNDGVFTEFEGENESGSGYEDIPSVLSASKDVFENIASYNFSQMRYLSRGYESGTADVYINGIRFNDALSGYSPYSLFSGLNEATREKESVTGLAISDYGVGGINGITNVSASASKVAKGYRFSVLTNSTTYRLRLMATYATGEMDNGWAFAASVSTRLGGNDYVTGVYYNALAYFLAAEKNINDRHRFGLTIFGSPVQRGAQNSSTQEVYDMLGNNYYNSNWGYQNGKVRNAKVRNNHEPVALFNYEFTPSYEWKVNVGLSYRFGRNGYSSLDWYDAPDPRPDYYRNLPSYYDDDPQKAAWVREGWLTDDNIRHINWERMYEVNRNSYFDDRIYYHPVIDPANTRRSKYILEERRTDQNDFNATASVTKRFGSLIKGSLGYNLRLNKTEYYKIVKDLLGGDYWFDVDQFAERDFGSGSSYQNNLLTPNHIVKEGEKYGYDYYAQIRNHRVWTSWDLNVAGFQATLGAEAGYNTFWREGLFQKGLFPDNSYGASEKQNFFTYSAKLGLNYKFTGQNMIYANVGYFTVAPYFEEAFLSPRTRNSVVSGLTTEKIFSADINYSLRVGDFAMRITGFFTDIKDQTDLISFYDDLQRAFTNFSMTGIDQRNFGIEAGVKVPIYGGLSLEGALSYGRYVYTSNPNVTQTIDNSERIVLENQKVYWKGYRVARTPQLASSVGLQWRGPDYLFIGLDLNYFDGMFISMNPLRRTDYAMVGMDLSTPEGVAAMRQMSDQERFPGAFILNASVGKSWSFDRKYYLGVNLNVNNLLNNRNIKSGGYEQMRLSANKDASGNIMSYTPFDSKYFYLYGINYMINVYFRF